MLQEKHITPVGILSPKTAQDAPPALDTYKFSAPAPAIANLQDAVQSEEIFTGYASDQMSDNNNNNNNNNNNDNNNNDDDDDKGNQADIEGDDEDGVDDHDCINDPTTQYRSFAAEVTPSNEVVSNACASTISAQEINHFSVAERKWHNAIIENSIPQWKHRKLEVPTHIHRQGQKNSLFLARTEAGQAIEKLLNAKKCPFVLKL